MFPRKRDLNQLSLLSTDLPTLLIYKAESKSLDGVSPKWTITNYILPVPCVFSGELNR